MLPMLAAFLMASCGDPTVSYWKKGGGHQYGILGKKATHWCNAS